MSFGLINAPTISQHILNDVFREFLDLFVIIWETQMTEVKYPIHD